MLSFFFPSSDVWAPGEWEWGQPRLGEPCCSEKAVDHVSISHWESRTRSRGTAGSLPSLPPTLATNNLPSLCSRLLGEHHPSRENLPIPFWRKMGVRATKDTALHRALKLKCNVINDQV